MDYESMVVISQLTGLAFFIVMFVIVVAYILWPGNQKKFNKAAQLPFEQPSAAHKRKS